MAALFIGLVIYRELDLKHLRQPMIEGGVADRGRDAAGGGLARCWAPTSPRSRCRRSWRRRSLQITTNKWAVLALLNVLFLLLGMFLHSAAAIILVVPIVMPLVNAVGIDPVHFGLIVTINLGIGQQTPPVASVLMAACSIAKAERVGSHQGQHLLHRRAGRRADAGHLRADHRHGPGRTFLPLRPP